jgi:hypothetical protein
MVIPVRTALFPLPLCPMMKLMSGPSGIFRNLWHIKFSQMRYSKIPLSEAAFSTIFSACFIRSCVALSSILLVSSSSDSASSLSRSYVSLLRPYCVCEMSTSSSLLITSSLPIARPVCRARLCWEEVSLVCGIACKRDLQIRDERHPHHHRRRYACGRVESALTTTA